LKKILSLRDLCILNAMGPLITDCNVF
jgi:hypothetical protein